MSHPRNAGSGPSRSIPSRDDVVRDVLQIRDDADGDLDWEAYQISRLRQALNNRKGRFTLLFAVANDPEEQRRLTTKIFASELSERPVEIVLKEDDDSILASLMEAPNPPAPLIVYGIDKLLPSTERRRDRRESTLDELQYRRELFRGLQRPIILWMPEYAYTMIGQKAPDFWSWQRGSFFFTSQGFSAESEQRFATSQIDDLATATPALSVHSTELEAVIRTVASGRNVALVGPWGTGKTTLGRAAARRLSDLFPDGTFYVDLEQPGMDGAEAGLRQILHAILGPTTLPGGVRALRAIYDDVLHDRKALLVFDDVSDTDQARLLIPPPTSRVLLISRNALDLAGIEQIRLGALEPDAAMALVRAWAPQLDVEEAKHVSALAAVSPLMLRLLSGLADGDRRSALQGAVEDADIEEAVQSIAALAIRRLSPQAQETLESLSVFEASFNISAAGAVSERPVEDVIAELTERGMVEATELDRFRLHPVVRNVARSRLSATRQRRLDELHSRYFLALLAFLEDSYRHRSEAQVSAMEHFRTEWPNLQQGQAWAARHASQDRETAELVVAYAVRGRYLLAAASSADERLAWFEPARDAAQIIGRPDLQGQVFEELGTIHRSLGNLDEAEQYTQRAVQAYRQALAAADREDASETLPILAALAELTMGLGDAESAAEHFRQLAEKAKQSKMPDFEVMADVGLGRICEIRGDPEEAETWYLRALEALPEGGDPNISAGLFSSLGEVAARKGDWAAAREWLQQAIDVREQVGNLWGIAEAQAALGQIALREGRHDEAEALLRRALQMSERLGDVRMQVRVLSTLAVVAAGRGDLDQAERLAHQQLLRAGDIAWADAKIEALRILGQVAELRGDYEKALDCFSKALGLLDNPDAGHAADALNFDLARALTASGRVEDGVKANLASIAIAARRAGADIRPNFDLLSRQRSLLGEERFSQVIRASVAPEIADQLIAAPRAGD